MKIHTILRLFQSATAAWWRHQSPARSAAIAFYTLIAMAPIMIFGIAGASRVFDDDAVRNMVTDEIAAVAGNQPAEVAGTVIDQISQPQGGLGPSLLAVAVMIFAVTAVFGQAHTALNQVWRVEREDTKHLVLFIRRRFLSLVTVFTLALAILSAVVVRVAIRSASHALHELGGTEPATADWSGAGLPIYFGVFLLFGFLNHVLPDAKVKWSEAALGGAVSAALFMVGAWAMSAYLSQAGLTSVYGAAGSLVITLIWVYYSSMVFLWGAEVARASHLIDIQMRAAHVRVDDDDVDGTHIAPPEATDPQGPTTPSPAESELDR